MLEEARRGPRWVGAGARGSGCEPPDAGAENWARVLCRRIDLLSCLTSPMWTILFPLKPRALYIGSIVELTPQPLSILRWLISYFPPFFWGGLRVGWVLSCIVGILHYNQSLLLSPRLYHSPVIFVCFGRDWTYISCKFCPLLPLRALQGHR